MNLSDLNPQARIAGAVIGLALWLAPAAGVWLYLTAGRSAAIDAAKSDARAECAKERADSLAAAIREAREEWDRTQASLDADARKDAEAIAASLDRARRDAARLANELSDHAKRHPLPVGCRADSVRLRLFNDARGADPAAGSP